MPKSKHSNKPHHQSNPPNPQKPVSSITAKPPTSCETVKVATVKSDNNSSLVLPEQMSLNAHEHIQMYLQKYSKRKLDKNDLTAVLRLSQHLRVFGLLSAVVMVHPSLCCLIFLVPILIIGSIAITMPFTSFLPRPRLP